VPDAQAAHEKTITSILPALAGASNIYGAGMLELGMSFSLEQLVIDDEINGMNYHPYRGIEVSDLTLDYEGIRKVGIGKDFLGEKNTMEYINVPSRARLFDREMFETWQRAGSKSLTDVAHDRVIDILKNVPQRTPLSRSQREEMDRVIKESDKTCPRI
jgi:trimethylamine--corrinoid protein Co-methyltransferase